MELLRRHKLSRFAWLAYPGIIILSMLVLALSGCSGDGGPSNSQFSMKSVPPVPTTRVIHDQLALIEVATGVPRSDSLIQSLMGQRGNNLPTVGGPVSGNSIQASMDLAAAACVEAVKFAGQGLPQNVFPSIVPFKKGPQAVNFPVDTVLSPLAAYILQQFDGKKPSDSEVAAFVAIIQSFLNQQISEGNTGTSGTARAMEATCVVAAANFGSLISP